MEAPNCSHAQVISRRVRWNEKNGSTCPGSCIPLAKDPFDLVPLSKGKITTSTTPPHRPATVGPETLCSPWYYFYAADDQARLSCIEGGIPRPVLTQGNVVAGALVLDTLGVDGQSAIRSSGETAA